MEPEEEEGGREEGRPDDDAREGVEEVRV